MSVPSVVGIVLIKNEDLFIDRVISNILDFCDEIIVADNLSKDRTSDKIRAQQQQHKKIHYHSIADPAQSHDLISEYANTATWIFAVDGDELYDPFGLKRLRQRINVGEYDRQWMILGNALNCTELDVEAKYAQGYLAPPCRSMTKLYNFNAIVSWKDYVLSVFMEVKCCSKRGMISRYVLNFIRIYLGKRQSFEHCISVSFVGAP